MPPAWIMSKEEEDDRDISTIVIHPTQSQAKRHKFCDKYVLFAILILGPLAIFAGVRLGKGPQNSESSSMRRQDGGSGQRFVILQSGQSLLSTELPICVDEVPICLKLQPDGNLFLYDPVVSKASWSSQINPITGEYETTLQSNGNLVTQRLSSNGNSAAIVWESQSKGITSDYQLVYESSSESLEVIRIADSGEAVVYWTTASIQWDFPGQGDADAGDEDNNGDDDVEDDDGPVWRPYPTPSPPTPLPVFGQDDGGTGDSNNNNEGGIAREPSPVPTPSTPPPVLIPATETDDDVNVSVPDWDLDGDSSDNAADSWNQVPWSSTYSLRSGPLVGHVTGQSVRLWALQGQKQPMELHYRILNDTTDFAISMPPNADQGAAILQISGLESSTQYEYQIRIAGEIVGDGVWKTAALENEPTRFNFMLASCMDAKRKDYKVQPVWSYILDHHPPDFAMLNGDTVYLNDGDWTSEGEIILERVWFRNLEQRNETHFKKFISRVPTLAVWDDHDYGMNDATKDQKGKHNSLRAFTNLWANPSAGTPSLEGVFYSFYRGNVHFIVCDNRWYRDQSTQSQFGPAQMKWLEDELRGSKGVFKIIVTGGDVMGRGWAADKREIGQIVTQYAITGVLFCAGDIHRNEMKIRGVGNWPYPLTQITSSGIGRSWRRPWAIVNVDTESSDPFIKVHFYGAETDDHNTTWTNDPGLLCSSILEQDRVAEQICTETITLSSLTP